MVSADEVARQIRVQGLRKRIEELQQKLSSSSEHTIIHRAIKQRIKARKEELECLISGEQETRRL